MNKREYLKYNQEKYDKLGKRIDIGDTVIINSHHWTTPCIGQVTHFVESGRVAIKYDMNYYGITYKCNAYRQAENIIIFKKSRKKK